MQQPLALKGRDFGSHARRMALQGREGSAGCSAHSRTKMMCVFEDTHHPKGEFHVVEDLCTPRMTKAHSFPHFSKSMVEGERD